MLYIPKRESLPVATRLLYDIFYGALVDFDYGDVGFTVHQMTIAMLAFHDIIPNDNPHNDTYFHVDCDILESNCAGGFYAFMADSHDPATSRLGDMLVASIA